MWAGLCFDLGVNCHLTDILITEGLMTSRQTRKKGKFKYFRGFCVMQFFDTQFAHTLKDQNMGCPSQIVWIPHIALHHVKTGSFAGGCV